MPLPAVVIAKSETAIRAELIGFSSATTEALLRLREGGDSDALRDVLPGMIPLHLPSGKPEPRALLRDEMRLREELGLDSLALTEMACKVGELIGVPIAIREVGRITTVGGLLAILANKLELAK